jgi:hypothetical protein
MLKAPRGTEELAPRLQDLKVCLKTVELSESPVRRGGDVDRMLWISIELSELLRSLGSQEGGCVVARKEVEGIKVRSYLSIESANIVLVT